MDKKLSGNPLQTGTLLLPQDWARSIYRLALSEEHFPVNIGNPSEMTILEFAERIRSHFPNAPALVFEPLPEDDPKRRCPDITKAKRILKWEPKVGLDEGLKLTVAYFKEQFHKENGTAKQ